MALKIGYCPWFTRDNYTDMSSTHNPEWIENTYFELDRLDTWKNSNSRFLECPAMMGYINNTFVLRSLVDLDLEWDDRNLTLLSNLSGASHDLMLRVHYEDFDHKKGFPI